MSQIAQLSEAEIEERFHIAGLTAIQFTLSGYAEHKVAFTVQFAEGREHFLTTLLAVDAEQGWLIIDCSGSADLNERFPESGRNVFVARPGGIHVQFSSGPARKISFEGAPAFCRGSSEIHHAHAAARMFPHRNTARSPTAISCPSARQRVADAPRARHFCRRHWPERQQ
jgi:hypothetical protein